MLESIKKIFNGLFIGLDSLELIVATIFATLIFFAIPYYLIKDLYQEGYVLLATIIVFIVISSFGICVRDFKKKKWSFLSIVTAILWGICFLKVAWELAS